VGGWCEVTPSPMNVKSCLYRWHVNKFYLTCTYNLLPEDEPPGSKRVEDVAKTKILF